MQQERFFHTASLLNNGKVLVTCGAADTLGINSTELYDPSKELWTNAGHLIFGRMWHAASILNNGNVLVIGGLIYATPIDNVQLYHSFI